MEIRCGIGTMQDKGFLVFDDGTCRTTFQLTPKQMQSLAQDIIFELKRNARDKRELFNAMSKSLADLNDGK